MSEFTRDVSRQISKGKLPVETRIEKLFDQDSFVETQKYYERSNAALGYADVTAPGEGVVTGLGRIDHVPIYLVAEDFAVLDGSFGVAHATKIIKTMEDAAKNGLPILFLWDSGGARIQEGTAVLDAYGRVLQKLVDLSGVVPTISVVLGDMLGAAAFFAPLTDFVIGVKNISHLGIKSATVIAATYGIDVEEEAFLGAERQGALGHMDFVCEDEAAAFACVKQLRRYLPSNNLEETPYLEAMQGESQVENAIVAAAVDAGSFLEIKKEYAKEMCIGFATIEGLPIGVVANTPDAYITPDAAKKAAAFIRFLDAYHIPLITFVDNKGVETKKQPVGLKDFAKLAYAYGEAGIPMISVFAGRVIGEGYTLMSNKANGADYVYALEGAEIGAVTAEAGSIMLFGGDQRNTAEYAEMFLSPLAAAKQGVVDDIVTKEALKEVLSSALEAAINKREAKLPKKHGNMPL
ncbi:MAG: carboxyl transferase domain-containing protein [Christensenellaceae bacterium]|jgi:acetyl-CoA carboxylase carboxyltransferase component